MPDYEKIEDIADNLKQYATTNIELAKLEIAERTSVAAGVVVSRLAIGLLAVLCFSFASLGLCFWLSALIGDTYSGFFIVGGVYLLLAVVLYVFRRRLIEGPIQTRVIRSMLGKV